eukprot:SAG31_NODE_1021_length_10327_cov_17.940653_4_plen_261_part_00
MRRRSLQPCIGRYGPAGVQSSPTALCDRVCCRYSLTSPGSHHARRAAPVRPPLSRLCSWHFHGPEPKCWCVTLCQTCLMKNDAAQVRTQYGHALNDLCNPLIMRHAAAGTIVMLGWLGSATGDFCDVDAYYAASHPTWRTVITVGGNDRWAKAAAAAEPWPAEEQCAKQLRRLSAELGLGRSHGTTRNNAVTGPIVMHLFSNNGIMLYSRLLAHLGDLGTAGAAVINRIRGVIFDSTPDPSYDPQLLKQVCIFASCLSRR